MSAILWYSPPRFYRKTGSGRGKVKQTNCELRLKVKQNNIYSSYPLTFLWTQSLVFGVCCWFYTCQSVTFPFSHGFILNDQIVKNKKTRTQTGIRINAKSQTCSDFSSFLKTLFLKYSILEEKTASNHFLMIIFKQRSPQNLIKNVKSNFLNNFCL